MSDWSWHYSGGRRHAYGLGDHSIPGVATHRNAPVVGGHQLALRWLEQARWNYRHSMGDIDRHDMKAITEEWRGA